MECSNCGEVLESGCSVSAGLRQEDRLILDWERRHKGRGCSGALRPFGKLKWQKKRKREKGLKKRLQTFSILNAVIQHQTFCDEE